MGATARKATEKNSSIVFPRRCLCKPLSEAWLLKPTGVYYKQPISQFSRFYRANSCDQHTYIQTDRQTDRQKNNFVAIWSCADPRRDSMKSNRPDQFPLSTFSSLWRLTLDLDTWWLKVPSLSTWYALYDRQQCSKTLVYDLHFN